MSNLKGRGFTLIELLIVITIIGILAIVLLSAINPLEQMRKARDAGGKADATELLNALERFFTTYGCYPWDTGYATQCSGGEDWNTDGSAQYVAAADFAAGGELEALVTTDEIKQQFTTRTNITDGDKLSVYEDTSAATDVVAVCFWPESQSAQNGGLGILRQTDNTVSGTACSDFDAPAVGTAEDCWVCVPQ